MYLLGVWLNARWPELGTSGWQMLGWGFFVSTVIGYHVTFLVNSISHTSGRRRFNTSDDSRNNWWVALLTLGEGWHNNHHRWPTSERQGFYWWELDITHYALRALSWLGLVWDLRTPPRRIYEEAERLERAA
jgi:stearoyl-CoA desaturase (delta-9 desaturase)